MLWRHSSFICDCECKSAYNKEMHIPISSSVSKKYWDHDCGEESFFQYFCDIWNSEAWQGVIYAKDSIKLFLFLFIALSCWAAVL